MFQYNWMVREEWFTWCEQVSTEELLRTRIGGAGSILYTLYHIADVECSWIRSIQGMPDIPENYASCRTLEQVRAISADRINETKKFLHTWSDAFDTEIVTASWMKDPFTKGEILRHVIAHGIHHTGQLSIWARELGLQPVSANFIGRGLF
ncbi:DinB family protein [Paenibacillus rhizovicinus]|nr:DinB family protein [Paenibacillus rhizovicinus]